MKHYLDWSRRGHSLKHILMAVIPAGFVFLGLIPYALIVLGLKLDNFLKLPHLKFGMVNWIVGGLLILVGGVFGVWSVMMQLLRANGTPLPMVPTQSLLITGPFRYCRNPMAFGTFLAYLGVGVLVGSISSVLFVVIFAVLLLTYIKLVEEKELEARFGQAYVDYKRVTPFIIPRLAAKKPTLERAIQIAARAHAGQVDKAGQPYILHPLRVMLKFSGEFERMAAVLHDVVEDTHITLGDLAAEGFPAEVLAALEALTKIKGEHRLEAAHRAAANPIARVVKLGDVADNMDLSRLPHPTAEDYARLEEYKQVREILIGELSKGY